VAPQRLPGVEGEAVWRVEHPAPEGFPWPEAPAEQDVFAPDYAPDEIAEIAQKLRRQAGFGGDAARRAA
jgi:hypothetical protein